VRIVSEALLPLPPEAPQKTARRGVRQHASAMKSQAMALRHEALVLWFILKDPRTPWYSRVVAGAAVGYVLSPVQLIPSFIPFIGLMDDVAVLSAGMALVRFLTTAVVLQDARARELHSRRRDAEKIKPALARTVTIAIAACWLLATIAAAIYLHRR
jgi:uncharacterized membrane protein YkvA (DUF1232 family)